jgi:SPP1 family predicted phage head-tail adaptor
MKHPTIGARRRRFTLELPLDTPDGFGGSVRTWAAGPHVWGSIEMLAQGQRFRAERPEDVVTHRVRVRWREGVSGAMRLTSGLRRFAIRSACDPDGRRRDLVCLVEEMTP